MLSNIEADGGAEEKNFEVEVSGEKIAVGEDIIVGGVKFLIPTALEMVEMLELSDLVVEILESLESLVWILFFSFEKAFVDVFLVDVSDFMILEVETKLEEVDEWFGIVVWGFELLLGFTKGRNPVFSILSSS